MDRRAHWDRVYATKLPEEVSWYQSVPERSLAIIESLGLASDDPIIDVGAGASRLVDHLLDRGRREVSALDISEAALACVRARLGQRAGLVHWIVADVTEGVPGGPYALWHDRAVFHFLTDPEDQRRYARVVHRALAPGARAVIAGFAPDGPQKCSGLEVVRHDGPSLAAATGLRLVHEEREDHVTPWGAAQRFVYAVLEREGEAGGSGSHVSASGRQRCEGN